MKDENKTKKQLIDEIILLQERVALLENRNQRSAPVPSEAFFEKLLNALDDLVFVKDRAHRWVFLNDAVCRFWHLSREKLIGKSDFDVFPKEQAEEYWAKDTEVFETKKTNLNVEEQTIQGKLYTIATKKSIYRDEATGEEYIVGTIRDITEHIKADELLKESEEKFRNLAEYSPNMIFINQKGKVVYANKKCEEVIGYTREEFLSPDFDFISIIAPEYRNKVIHSFKRHMQGGEVHPYHYMLITKEGKRIDAIITTKLVNFGGEHAILGIITDISDLKQAEAKLRESEERYRNLIELAPEGIATVDLKGTVLSVNSAFSGLTGFSREEIVGKHFTKIPTFLPKNITRFLKLFASMLRGKIPSPVRFMYRRKDGVLRWAEAHSGFIVENGRKTGIQVIVRDITERYEYEEDLRNSELLYRSTIDSLGDAIHMVDNELNILLCNRGIRDWNKTLGFDQELQGKNLMDVYPFLSDSVFQEYDRVFKSGKLLITEDKNIIDGRELITETRKIPVVEKGKVTKVITVIRDITEQKRAEEALRESESQYRTLFDSVGETIFICERSGRFIEVNQIAIDRLGYSRKELLKLTPMDLLSKEHASDMVDFGALASANEQRIFEATHVSKDGKIIPVEILSRPIEYRGKPAVLLMARDITERKEAQKALRESEEMLIQAQKMEAIGRLAGGIAHDFNNLLTAILGYTDILTLDSTLGENEKEFVGEIKKSAERAALLTQRLLAFSRKQVLQPSMINLNTLIKNLEKMLIRIIGEDIDLCTKLDPDLGNLKADQGQVEQVITNLIVNARDAMPKGGKITIETGDEYLNDCYCHLGHRVKPGEYVFFSVSDTGSGIEERMTKQIFEPFFTTKERGKGTGLGLSTVYGIIHQSGGYIFLRSRMGHGTTFKIYLPQVYGEKKSDIDGSTLTLPSGGKETVLVVEDEEMVRKMVSSSLKRFGYTVIEAPDAYEAIKRFDHEKVDMLLTDVIMPGMSGSELANVLRESHKELPVLFISGYTADAIGQHGVLEEGEFFLQKPFTPYQLAEKVREVLD
jgi:two-component system cell cycle sensor histidine kinase/response regulator CckA